MAVVPGQSRPIPDGAFVSTGLKNLQDVTESSAKAAIRGQVVPSITNAKNAFFANIVSGFANAIKGAFDSSIDVGSWFGEVKEAMQYVRDGQEDLNNRADLLSPLLDYCSVYAGLEENGHAQFGTGIIPFTKRIGPSKNVTTSSIGGVPTRRWYLMDKGLWNIDLHLVASWTGLGNNNNLKVILRVLDSSGRVYSEQAAVEKTNNVTTINISSSVVIPEPYYSVEAAVEECDKGRGFYGGPKWSRLTMQHISREVENGTGAESSTPDPTSNGPDK